MTKPAAAEIHVWWTRPEAHDVATRTGHYESLLAADERDRYQRFVRAEDRRTYLVARALTRTILAEYANADPAALTFDLGPFGKPSLSNPSGGPPLQFSLSHTRGLVALAVATHHEVGIDVEQVDRQVECVSLARQFFSPRESAEVAAAPVDRQLQVFLDYWTLKEAYVKATGLGLSAPLERFWFDRSAPPVISFADAAAEDASGWHFTRLPFGPSHAGAVAMHTGSDRPQVVVRYRTP